MCVCVCVCVRVCVCVCVMYTIVVLNVYRLNKIIKCLFGWLVV